MKRRPASVDEAHEPKLTPKFIAKNLGVGTMTVYRLVERGDLRAYRVGRSIRIPLSAFREYLGDAEFEPGAP